MGQISSMMDMLFNLNYYYYIYKQNITIFLNKFNFIQLSDIINNLNIPNKYIQNQIILIINDHNYELFAILGIQGIIVFSTK